MVFSHTRALLTSAIASSVTRLAADGFKNETLSVGSTGGFAFFWPSFWFHQVDVIYADHPKVVAKWHDLYDYIHIRPMDQKQYEHRILALLSEIATTLGYESLKQIDIDKYYFPEGHGYQAKMNEDIQKEFLRVLQNTESLSAIQKSPAGRGDATPA